MWRDSKLKGDPNYFNHLSSGHKPSYMWIGCADARVPANEIMGEDAGSVFVVRNVANQVIGSDFKVMSALLYAVGVLEVPHIIVCGHYDCGGIRASMVNRDHSPPLENWLRNIRDVYRLHRKELDAISDLERRHRRLVELNVVEQCINLYKTGAIQKKRVETFRDKGHDLTQPRIHAVVFDPATGLLNQLKVDFRAYIEELHEIYDLYALEHYETEQKRNDAKLELEMEEGKIFDKMRIMGSPENMDPGGGLLLKDKTATEKVGSTDNTTRNKKSTPPLEINVEFCGS